MAAAAPKKPNRSSQPSKILERAFTQANMKVINQLASPIGGNDAANGYNINFSLLGNTGNIYSVVFNLDISSRTEQLTDPVISCTCPYYSTHRQVCKHIYVVYIKVFRVVPDIISPSPTLSLGQRQLLVGQIGRAHV